MKFAFWITLIFPTHNAASHVKQVQLFCFYHLGDDVLRLLLLTKQSGVLNYPRYNIYYYTPISQLFCVWAQILDGGLGRYKLVVKLMWFDWEVLSALCLQYSKVVVLFQSFCSQSMHVLVICILFHISCGVAARCFNLCVISYGYHRKRLISLHMHWNLHGVSKWLSFVSA